MSGRPSGSAESLRALVPGIAPDCTRLPSRVLKDSLDHRRFESRRDDLEFSDAVRANANADLEAGLTLPGLNRPPWSRL
jgi:hypothetical protein